MQHEIIESKNKSEHLLKNQSDLNANEIFLNNQLNNNYNNLENNFLIQNTEKKEEFIQQTNEIDHVHFNLYFFIRSFLIVIMVALISLNTVYGFALPHGNVKCLEDSLFTLTEGFNKYFHQNTTVRRMLIIVSSFCVDFMVLYMCVIWCLWGKSWRIIVSLFCFYFLRGIVQSIFQMSYPDGYIWEYPGFPSVMVSYLKTNDFFFSGHVGLPILMMCEFQLLKRYFMFSFCIMTFFIEAFTMLVTRGHYTIDLITGAIFAHYIFQNVEKNIHYFDRITFTKMEKENHEKNIFDNNNNNNSNESDNNQANNFSNQSRRQIIGKLNSEFSPVPIKHEV